MRHVEIINESFKHVWEECRFGTLTQEKIEELESTTITEEAALECFDRKNWWYPDPVKNPQESDNISKWDLDYCTCSVPKFILFDSLDGETQIIREIEFVSPRYKRLTESQRVIYNPKTGVWKSLVMPRNDMNPYKVFRPFYGTNKDYIDYKLGGYNNIFSNINFGECFFYFRRLVPGIKREDIMKRDISMVYEYGEKLKGPIHLGEYNSCIWMHAQVFKSLVTGNSLFEIIWDLGFKDNLYNSSASTRGLDFGFLENHKQSFLISRRNGVNFSEPGIITLWIDTIKLLEKYGMDIKSPKYIAKELQRTHDLLVSREIKRHLEDQRRRERDQRIAQEKLIRREKEKLREEDQEYRKSKEKYLDWEKKNGDLKIIPVQSASDCLEVGLELSNCCYSTGYYKLKDSLLLKVYVSEVLTELAEIGVHDHEVYQCLGKYNRKSKDHTRILKFLDENIKDLP